MSVTQPWDPPPGRDAPYGEQLTYWLNKLGMSNRELARGASVDRTYPGHIKSGRRTPHPQTADNIRSYLVTAAQQPGPYGRPRLTERERLDMDDLLRTSFDHANTARDRRKQHIDDGTAEDAKEPSASLPPSNLREYAVGVYRYGEPRPVDEPQDESDRTGTPPAGEGLWASLKRSVRAGFADGQRRARRSTPRIRD